MTMTVGVDLGKMVDPSVIIAVQTYRPEEQSIEDRPEKHHYVRWLEKVPLQTSYLEVVERIATVAERATQYGSTTIVYDATGVGQGIDGMLQKRTTIHRQAVTFTAGREVKRVGPYSVRVPKRDLAEALEIVLQSRRLHVHPDVPAEDLIAELNTFDRTISELGHVSYEAGGAEPGRSGARHDDLVMALALALWHGERGSHGEAFVEYWRTMAARS